jgi:hypothetical protein
MRGRMKLDNTSDIPNEIIRDIVRFVRPPGIKNFKVRVRNKTGYMWAGWGNGQGISVRVNTSAEFPRMYQPYQYGQLKARWTKPDPVTGARRRLKGRRYYLTSLVEMLIVLFAHELMHTRQGQPGRIRGRVWGARGRFSEIQTSAYEIRMLRWWRKLDRVKA